MIPSEEAFWCGMKPFPKSCGDRIPGSPWITKWIKYFFVLNKWAYVQIIEQEYNKKIHLIYNESHVKASVFPHQGTNFQYSLKVSWRFSHGHLKSSSGWIPDSASTSWRRGCDPSRSHSMWNFQNVAWKLLGLTRGVHRAYLDRLTILVDSWSPKSIRSTRENWIPT